MAGRNISRASSTANGSSRKDSRPTRPCPPAAQRDDMTALMLASLDVTDELFREREDKQRAAGDVGARLGALVLLLEQTTGQ